MPFDATSEGAQRRWAAHRREASAAPSWRRPLASLASR